jgi:Domain of unknown function (DUF397)
MTASSTADPGMGAKASSYVHNFPTWRRSTFSGGTNCVEVALAGEAIYIRDSKSPVDGQMLATSLSSWQALLNRIRAGELSL